MSLSQAKIGFGNPTDDRAQSGAPRTVSTQAFAGDLNQVPGTFKRTHVTMIPGLESNKMRALATGTSATIRDRNMTVGPNSSAYLAGHLVPASEAGAYSPAPPTHLASHTEQTNGPIPIGRILGAPNAYEIPGDRQLVLIKRTDVPSQRIDLSKSRAAGATKHGVSNTLMPLSINPRLTGANTFNTAAYEYADGNTLLTRSVSAWNNMSLVEGEKDFIKDPVAYSRLTPLDVWAGCKHLWTGWFVDGVARVESIDGGPSSTDSDGYNVRLGRSGHNTNGQAAAQKAMSVVRAGRVSMLDYYNSRGITRGSSMFLVLRKTPMPKKGAITFVHTNKAGTAHANPDGVVRSFDTPTVEVQRDYKSNNPQHVAYFKALKRGYMGFTLHFVCVPHGGSPDRSFYEYEDEWGHKHHDALVMRFGRVLFEPYRFTPQPTLLTSQTDGFKPYTNGTEAMVRMPFPDVILDPCKDGFLGMF